MPPPLPFAELYLYRAYFSQVPFYIFCSCAAFIKRPLFFLDFRKLLLRKNTSTASCLYDLSEINLLPQILIMRFDKSIKRNHTNLLNKIPQIYKID